MMYAPRGSGGISTWQECVCGFGIAPVALTVTNAV